MLMYHNLNFITTYSNFVKTSDGHTHFPHITYSYLCNGIIQYNNLIIALDSLICDHLSKVITRARKRAG